MVPRIASPHHLIARTLGATLLALLAAGCATTGERFDGDRSTRLGATSSEERHADIVPADPAHIAPTPTSTDALPTYRSASIPPGLRCLLRLHHLGIAYRPLPSMALINTPIEVLGPIAGIHYKPTWRARFIVDCRFALALHRAGPFFRALGIKTGYFSNTHRRHHGSLRKVSRHALGLAMDLHRVRDAQGKLLRVKRDFEHDLDDACDNAERPALNRLACLLKRHGVFDYVLTPDTNRAHYNHFHLSILDLERRRKASRRREHPVLHE